MKAPPLYGGSEGVRPAGGGALGRGSIDPDLFGSSARSPARLAGSKRTRTCSSGDEIVNAGLKEQVAADCHVVSRQLSHDPFRDPAAQNGTEVEPDSFSYGSVVVATFQAGRFVDGGSVAIGFATSRNAGTSWRNGFLPGLAPPARVAAAGEFVSDPAVAYDAKHRAWLIASLGGNSDTASILISRSANGLTWKAPVVAVKAAPDGLDKNWIACDNWPASPHRGRCYLSYLAGEAGGIVVRSSDDGGKTWTHAAGAVLPLGRTSPFVNGAQPLVRPDGTLLLPYTAISSQPGRYPDEIALVRSTDGGLSFTSPQRVSVLGGWAVREVRDPQFVSGDVGADGTAYLAWQGCPFEQGCDKNVIVLSRSANGTSWSAPTRVPTVDPAADAEALLPGLAVAPGTSGARTGLALASYSVAPCLRYGLGDCSKVDISLVLSADGGRTWGAPQRLDERSMRLTWLADSGLGRMLGDYISTSFSGGKPIPVFALATAPGSGTFRQTIFATTRVAR